MTVRLLASLPDDERVADWIARASRVTAAARGAACRAAGRMLPVAEAAELIADLRATPRIGPLRRAPEAAVPPPPRA